MEQAEGAEGRRRGRVARDDDHGRPESDHGVGDRVGPPADVVE